MDTTHGYTMQKLTQISLMAFKNIYTLYIPFKVHLCSTFFSQVNGETIQLKPLASVIEPQYYCSPMSSISFYFTRLIVYNSE